MTTTPALLAELASLDVTTAYGPLTPHDALDVLHDIATDQSPFESEREALLWAVAVGLHALAPMPAPTPRARTLLATLADAAAGWTEEEIEWAMRRAKRQPRG